MAEQSEAIARFQKMAEADPTNELGHFSLGKALLEAGRFQEAEASLQRAISLNPNMGRAYQLAADALVHLNRKPDAIAHLTSGVKVASARGEAVPKREMIAMLQELGAPIPEEQAAPAQPVGEGEVFCKRCGRVRPKLARPPMRGPFGEEVYANICSACWREAIAMGTKVINELRLPLDDPQATKIWDQHIREFLNLTGSSQ